jgi:class 3 adenylate cyclase
VRPTRRPFCPPAVRDPTSACASCGAAHRADARFCDECGAALADPVVPVRKTVTALFCDVSGSTALAHALDPEALRAVLERNFARASHLVGRH